MKILQIKINNLASLEGESIIDFTVEPLLSAGIFAITGPTGAGKSTILDALCLALYGRTPRYVQANQKGVALMDSSGEAINQGDPRSILRDGTASGSASVAFVGLDGDHYEATWAVRRSRNQITGKLTASTQSLYNLTHQREVPGTKTIIGKEIERLVGLSFEQFTRSVLLAQGDFTAFMKADKDEKSALLEKLTGSQIYSEISKTIYEHYKEEEQKLKELQNNAGGIELLTEEALQALEEAINQAKASITDLEVQKKALDHALHWHEQHQQLSEKLTAAKTALSQTEVDAQTLTSTRTELALVQLAAPLKSTEEQLQTASLKLQNLNEQLSAVKESVQILEEKKQSLLSIYQEALEKKQKAELEIKLAAPQISEAMELDAALKSGKEQYAGATALLATILANKNSLEEKKKTAAQQLDQNIQALQATKQWIEQKADRKAIAENTQLILSKLEGAGRALSALTTSKAEQQSLQEALTQIKEAHTDLSTKINSEETSSQQRIQQLKTAKQDLAVADLNSLETSIDAVTEKASELFHAKSLFDDLCKIRKEYTEGIARQKAAAESIENLKNDIRLKSPELQTLDTALQTTRSLTQKAALRHSENIEQLRTTLQQGDPCPVCGSTEHPYGSGAHVDLADDLLNALKEDEQKAQQALDALRQLLRDLQSELKLKEKELAQAEKQNSEKVSVIEELEDQWQSSDYGQTTTNLSEKEILSKIEADQKGLVEQQKSLQQRKQAATELRATVDKLQQAVEKEKDTLQQNKDQLNQLHTSLQLKTAKLDSLSKSQTELDGQLTAIQAQLDPYFPTKDWYQNWTQGQDRFTAAIERFCSDWQLKQKDIERLEKEAYQLNTAISGVDIQLTQIATQLTDQQLIVDGIHANNEDISKKRKLLFAGKAVTEVQASMQAHLEQVTKMEQGSKKSLDETLEQLKEAELKKTFTQKQIVEQDKEIATLDQKITHWLSDYNQSSESEILTRERLKELLSYSENWIQLSTESIKALDLRLEDQKSRLAERSADLEQHLTKRVDSRAQEQVLQLQEQLKSQLSTIQLQVAEKEFTINNNQKNIKKLSGIQKSITDQEIIFDAWASLNQLLGSKEGHKFREIAQQYTLDLLLRYANQHLHLLSKRYVLSRIQGTLGIQVIDQDMADEIRSVYSLSGGESFLVSLALALGLASLSSKRLKVESLFIDEGFGSLDPSTLSVAMDALERLQDLGRKVGVISHVQEMTERIPVQINVQKRSSGRSNIEVISLM